MSTPSWIVLASVCDGSTCAKRARFRARRLLRGGGLRLLWFVVHGLALHEQSVCRPRCAVLAGLVGVRARKERSDKKIAARVGPVERAGPLVTAGRPGR